MLLSTQAIQEYILSKTGIKSSVKKGTGSMKGYLIFSPMLQSGIYPIFPHDFLIQLKPLLPSDPYKPAFTSGTMIHVYGIADDRVDFKKERKKTVDPDKMSKGWGSQNSQLRLDKAAFRYAKKLNRGGCARY